MANPLRIIYTDTPESSAIARIGWHPVTQELRIVFFNRDDYPEYIFGGVDEELAKAFLLAASKGRFYHKNIAKRTIFRLDAALGSFRLSAVGRRITKAVRSTRS